MLLLWLEVRSPVDAAYKVVDQRAGPRACAKAVVRHVAADQLIVLDRLKQQVQHFRRQRHLAKA